MTPPLRSSLTAAALLIGFSAGQPITPNYRWCADTPRGLACFARQADCKAVHRNWCQPRLVAEPAPYRAGQGSPGARR